ncbi:MAG TPA: hypothetical protein VFF58_01015 [Candidatus Nitrosotalea sp.]|nr:hypothetical protein [Candidatus Nitrosotalea sp.]
MKRLFALALLLSLAGCSGRKPIRPPAPPPIVDHSIALTWNQSFVNNPACSTTVTTSCISGFREGYVVGTTQTQLHTDTSAVCTGTSQPLTCASTFNGILPLGNVIFYVLTVGVDQNGAVVTSASAALSPGVPVALDGATNVNATVGP